jgi:hypothetical protein
MNDAVGVGMDLVWNPRFDLILAWGVVAITFRGEQQSIQIEL